MSFHSDIDITDKEFMEDDFITITRQEYDELLKRDSFLSCLEEAGVDEWSVWDEACVLMEENNE